VKGPERRVCSLLTCAEISALHSGVLFNFVLRRISGPKREKIAGGCRRLHHEELCNLYTSLDIVRVIKSRRMRWTGI